MTSIPESRAIDLYGYGENSESPTATACWVKSQYIYGESTSFKVKMCSIYSVYYRLSIFIMNVYINTPKVVPHRLKWVTRRYYTMFSCTTWDVLCWVLFYIHEC